MRPSLRLSSIVRHFTAYSRHLNALHPIDNNETLGRLIVVRHGETPYNKKKLWCGWSNVDLTEDGAKGANVAGGDLGNLGFIPDKVYVSPLVRAQKTARYILKGMGLYGFVEVQTDVRLVEQHVGALTGTIKTDENKKIIAGPDSKADPMIATHPEFFRIIMFPSPVTTESRRDVIERTKKFYENEIVNSIKSGKNILVVAHSNSLKALYYNVTEGLPEAERKITIGNTEPLEIYFRLNEKGDLFFERASKILSPEPSMAPKGSEALIKRGKEESRS